MSFIVGTGTTCQIGKESAYGVKATMTDLVNLTSETLATTVEKADEGSLLASPASLSRNRHRPPPAPAPGRRSPGS